MKVYVIILINRDDLQFILYFIKMLRNAREKTFPVLSFIWKNALLKRTKVTYRINYINIIL